MEIEKTHPDVFTGEWEDNHYNNILLELSRYAKFTHSNPGIKLPSTLRLSNTYCSDKNLFEGVYGKYVITISSSRDIDDNISHIDIDALMRYAVNSIGIDINWKVDSPNGVKHKDYDSITLSIRRNHVSLTRDTVLRNTSSDIKTSKIYTTEWNNENLNLPVRYSGTAYFDSSDRKIKAERLSTVKGKITDENPNPKDSIMTLTEVSEYFDNIRKTTSTCFLDGFEKFHREEITIANDNEIICKYSNLVSQVTPHIGNPSSLFTLRREDEEKIYMDKTLINVRRIPYGFDRKFTIEDIANLCIIINPEFDKYIKYVSILEDVNTGIPSSEEDK